MTCAQTILSKAARGLRSLASRALLPLAVVGVAGGAALADEVKVAVAANFSAPAKEIAAAFTAKTGRRAVLVVGASGQFYAQAVQGAPFEVFLSADEERPRRLEALGVGVRGSRFTYAVGRLVLWSPTPGFVDAQGQVLTRGGFSKIAIADPGAAPYGAAAIETMTRMGVLPALQAKIVKGTSISQAYQFVQSGAAELGFVALSQVVADGGGSRWLVPPSFHSPIIQQAILLQTGAADPDARAFLAFLRSPEALAIIRRFGYGAP